MGCSDGRYVGMLVEAQMLEGGGACAVLVRGREASMACISRKPLDGRPPEGVVGLNLLESWMQSERISRAGQGRAGHGEQRLQ